MAIKQLVENSIWNDTWFKSLPDKSKLLFLYLLINPEQTPAGIFEIDIDVLAVKFKMKNPLFEIEKLSDKVVFDAEKSLIWIKNYYLKNSKGEKMLKSVENTVKKHKNSFIVTDFCDSNGLCFGLDRVSHRVSNRVLDSPSILSNEHEHEHEHEKEKSKQKPCYKQKAPILDFDAAYFGYPRKLGKAKGITKLKKLVTTSEQYEKLLKAISNYSASCRADNTDQKYIKHFSTFAGEWEDFVELDLPENPDDMANRIFGGSDGNI